MTDITYEGKHYDEFYLTDTYGLNLVMAVDKRLKPLSHPITIVE